MYHSPPWNGGRAGRPSPAGIDVNRMQRQRYWDDYLAADYSEFNSEYCMPKYRKPWWETTLGFAINNHAWRWMRTTLLPEESQGSAGMTKLTGQTPLCSANSFCQLAYQTLVVTPLQGCNRVPSEPRTPVSVTSTLRRQELAQLGRDAGRVRALLEVIRQRNGNISQMAIVQSLNYLTGYRVEGTYPDYPQQTLELVPRICDAVVSTFAPLYATMADPDKLAAMVSLNFSGMVSTFCNSSATPYTRQPWCEVPEPVRRRYPSMRDIVLIQAHRAALSFDTCAIARVANHMYVNQGQDAPDEPYSTQVYAFTKVEPVVPLGAATHVSYSVNCWSYGDEVDRPPSLRRLCGAGGVLCRRASCFTTGRR